MAIGTDIKLRQQLIYSVFTRNYSKQGSFKAVQADLPRIKALGTDIIWLMPIQPIGQKNRKGTLGSPYAISDYRGINPELGTMADFIALTKAIHEQGMRVMIDVVYNHTSPDSKLLQQHPDWFYHKPDGSFGNRVADWSDIIDLDYGHHELWDYQIQTLKQWADYVDGFRCDVAPLVPLAFWLEARHELAEYKPGLIWLAETNGPDFIKQVREAGFDDLSDSEIYQAFDLTYDYDVLEDFRATVKGERSLSELARILMKQDVTYPKNYVKMRFLENHDVPRAAQYLPDSQMRRNMLSFSLFQKGAGLIYNGEEFGAAHLPSLFDADPIALDGTANFSELISRLATLKHQTIFSTGTYTIKAENKSVMSVTYTNGSQKVIGYFAFSHFIGDVACQLPTGDYPNKIDQTTISVVNEKFTFTGEPVIVGNI